MSFQSPWAFWLLIPLAAVLGWSFFRRRHQQASLLYSQTSVLATVRPGLRVRLMYLPAALKAVALVLAICALARPQKSDERVQRNVEGIDIMMTLDISDSMLIEDMKPTNRLEAAKDVMKRFVKQRTSDRIGVVIFSGESFTLVPLTLDYQLILSRLDEVTTAQDAHIKDGTAIGVGIANAAGKLKESTAKSRVMIFMTDGENNSGTIDPETGLAVAKGYGIKIYTIGIGQGGPTRIPIYQKDVFGNKVKTYQPFEDEVNEPLLKKMAEETGGKFFRANKEDSLSGIFAEIDKLEKTKIDVNKFTRYEELFHIFLIPAVLIYLLGILLSLTWLRRLP